MLSVLFMLSLSSAWACEVSEGDLLYRLAQIRAQQEIDEYLEYRLGFHDLSHKYGNFSKREFKDLIDKVKKAYAPIFRKLGQTLRIEHNWEDDELNARAGIRGNVRFVLLYGGYARHPRMTKDAYLTVICHEIGHHLGGFPVKKNMPWSSTEGQADYFSTLKCMKEVLKDDKENERIALSLVLPRSVDEACRQQFPKKNDYYICLRSARAAEDYGNVAYEILNPRSTGTMSLLTPDQEQRFVTNFLHPSPQCRVDTKYQGALCNVPVRDALDRKDETRGVCHPRKGHTLGNRPACWFIHR